MSFERWIWPLNTFMQKHKALDNTSTLGQIINVNLGIILYFQSNAFFINRYIYELCDIDFIILPFKSLYYNKTFFFDKVNLMNIYGWWSATRFDDHVPEKFMATNLLPISMKLYLCMSSFLLITSLNTTRGKSCGRWLCFWTYLRVNFGTAILKL